jgi:hypothetical protein
VSFLSQPLSLLTVKPKRAINPQQGLGTGPLAAATNYTIDSYVTLTESTNDTLTITKQPVQQGASIADHAYKEPTTFGTTIYFQDNLTKSLSQMYADFLALQSQRILCDVVTPKRTYKNMMIAALGVTTDSKTENTLAIQIGFQEVIIVNVTAATVPRTKQRNPGSTGATEKAGNKSAIKTLVDGVKSSLKGV